MAYRPIILNLNPGEEYHTRHRLWQGCPSILRTPRGRLFAAWYSGGAGEPDPDNYNLLIRSEDDGWTWSEPELVVPSEFKEHGYIAIDVQLWLDPLDRMWLFITQRYFGKNRLITDPDHLAVWAAVCDDPDADHLEWHEPRFISQGFLRTQPTVLSNGDWVLCAYDWSSPNYRYSRSNDQGKTWVRCEAGRKVGTPFDETMILERKDHSLVMFARANRPLLAECTSPDPSGTVWTPGEFTGTLNAQTRFYVRRLKSGRVLLIHNNAAGMRTNLCARLSEDDGFTWKYTLELDQAASPDRAISYPDAVQADDGRIFIIYDCGRTTAMEIRMAQITEEDIMHGSLCDHASYLNRIISKGPCVPDPKRTELRMTWMREVYAPSVPNNAAPPEKRK